VRGLRLLEREVAPARHRGNGWEGVEPDQLLKIKTIAKTDADSGRNPREERTKFPGRRCPGESPHRSDMVSMDLKSQPQGHAVPAGMTSP